MATFESITKEHYQRVVDIVGNIDNEFNDVYEKMGAINARLTMFNTEMEEYNYEN